MNKKNKIISALLMASAFLFSLSSCGVEVDITTTDDVTTTTIDTITSTDDITTITTGDNTSSNIEDIKSNECKLLTINNEKVKSNEINIIVDNEVSTYNFINNITISDNATAKAYKDYLDNEITSLISLNEGNNKFFILILAENEIDSSIYEITIYRKYKYTISFDMMGADERTSYKLNEGSTISSLPNPMREGYEFVGWYCDGAQVQFPVTINNNITFQARWNKIPTASYIVKHYKESLSGTRELVMTQELTGAIGEETNALAKDYVGFTAKDFEQQIITDDELIIEIDYARNEYELIANATTGGSIIADNGTYKYGYSVSVVAVAQGDYLFNGWYCNGKYVSKSETLDFTMPAADYHLEARFSKQYELRVHRQNFNEDDYDDYKTISYDSAGEMMRAVLGLKYEGFYDIDYSNLEMVDGSLDVYFDRMVFDLVINYPGGLPIAEKYYYGQSYSIESPVYLGYEFVNWELDGNNVSDDKIYDSIMPLSNLSFNCIYRVSDNTPYYVKYYFENIDNNSYTLDDAKTEIKYGTTFTTTTVNSKPFDGFTCNDIRDIKQTEIKADGSGEVAVYYRRNTYSITVLTSPASIKLPTASSSNVLKYGDKLDLSVYTASGYTFKDIEIKTEGEDDEVVISSDTSYTYLCDELQNRVITVYYTANTDTEYQVRHYYRKLGASDYSYYAEVLHGTTGEEPPFTTYFNDITEEYFTYSGKNGDKLIKGDGSSIVGLYYNRKTFEVNVTPSIAGATEKGITIASSDMASATSAYALAEVELSFDINTIVLCGFIIDSHYFLGWYDSDDNLLSKNDIYSFTITEDVDIVAKFIPMHIEARFQMYSTQTYVGEYDEGVAIFNLGEIVNLGVAYRSKYVFEYWGVYDVNPNALTPASDRDGTLSGNSYMNYYKKSGDAYIIKLTAKFKYAICVSSTTSYIQYGLYPSQYVDPNDNFIGKDLYAYIERKGLRYSNNDFYWSSGNRYYIMYDVITYGINEFFVVRLPNPRSSQYDINYTSSFNESKQYENGYDANGGKTFAFLFRPIDWVRVTNDGDKSLYITQNVIDASLYNVSYGCGPYETSLLRKFINDWFINIAFDVGSIEASIPTELANDIQSGGGAENCKYGFGSVTDRIFAPSREEYENYASYIRTYIDTNNFVGTDYAYAMGLSALAGDPTAVWTRSGGINIGGYQMAQTVSKDVVFANNVNPGTVQGIRLATWIYNTDVHS